MQPDALAPLIPIAAIIMFGLVRISRHWRPGGLPQSPAATRQLEERLDAVERDVAAVRRRAQGEGAAMAAPSGRSMPTSSRRRICSDSSNSSAAAAHWYA